MENAKSHNTVILFSLAFYVAHQIQSYTTFLNAAIVLWLQREKNRVKINNLIRLYYSELRFMWSRGIVVGTETRLRAGRSVVRIPVYTRDFSLLHKVQTGSGAYPAY